jgi:hypothetical protein
LRGSSPTLTVAITAFVSAEITETVSPSALDT